MRILIALICLIGVKSKGSFMYGRKESSHQGYTSKGTNSSILEFSGFNVESRTLMHDHSHRGPADISVLEEFEDKLISKASIDVTENFGVDSRELSVPSFTCQRMNTTFNPMFMCSDVVDYSYYLPQGTTLDDLETIVRATVPSSWSLMTGTCLSDYKKMMCSRVFLECVDGVIADDVSTYIDSLPYKKPCKSLCQSASATGSTCGGFLEAIGVNMTCSNMDIYSQAVDSSGTCNYLASHVGVQVVSDRVEVYNGTLCTGVVENVYMGDSNMTMGYMHAGLAKLLPPGVHQEIVEETLEVLNSIPRWLQTGCLTAMRKAFCSVSFMPPEAKDDLVPYGFGTVYLPKMPHYSICTDYTRSCAAPLADIFADVPGLHIDCNMTAVDTKGTVRVFPATTQVLAAVPLGATTIYMTTDPTNTSASANFAISSQCPYGFEDKGLTPSEEQPFTVPMLSASPASSECVFQCPVKTFTDEDRTKIYNVKVGAFWCSFILGLLSLINVAIMWYQKGDNPLKHPFLNIPVTQFFVNFISIIAMYDVADPISHICSGDTTWYRWETVNAAWTGSGGSTCAAEALIGSSSILAMMVPMDQMTMIASELYLRVIHKSSNSSIANIKPYLRVASCILHFFPAFVAFCLTGAFVPPENETSYFGITSMFTIGKSCSYSTGNMSMDLLLLAFPVILSYIIVTIVSLYTLGHCVAISYRALSMQEDNPITALWKTYKFLFITNFIYLLFATYIIFIQLLNYSAGSSPNPFANFQSMGDAILTYYTCVIGGFTSLEADPSGGKNQCSLNEVDRWFPVGNVLTALICGAISSAWAVTATWSEAVSTFYWSMLPPTVQETLVKVRSVLFSAFSVSKGIKVLPVADHGTRDDLEMAKLKEKVKGGSLGEETKAIDEM